MATNKNKLPKGCLYAVIIAGILFLYFLIAGDSKNFGGDGPWASWTNEQKNAWMSNYLKYPDKEAQNLGVEMAMEIKDQFKYPAEVKFDQAPILSRAMVLDAYNGDAILQGSGIAKNGFGVKISFLYDVRFTCTKDTLYIKKVIVNEK